MPRNIIWDVDGTLFDTYPAIVESFHTAARDLGADVPRAWLDGLARISLGLCASNLAARYGLDREELERLFGAHYGYVKPEEQPPFPGVVAVCRYIRACGGKNLIVTHRGREGTAQLLAAHAMADCFAGCLTRDDGYPRKPDPAAFLALIERHGLPRDETMAVGDRDLDILAGRAAGLTTCLFAPRGGDTPADLVISGFDELFEYLEKAEAMN